MERNKMKIGQKVRLSARDIISYKSDNPDDEDSPMTKVVRHQKEKIMFVRELHNPKMAGLSYSMHTPPEKSYGIFYENILNWQP